MSALKESLALFKQAAERTEGKPSETLREALTRFKEAAAVRDADQTTTSEEVTR